MRICIVSSTFPPQAKDSFCGVGDYSYRLSTALAERSVSVEVVTSSSYSGKAEPFRAVNVHPIIDSWGPLLLGKISRLLDDLATPIVNLQYQQDILAPRWSPLNSLLPRALRASARRLITTFHGVAHPSPVSMTRVSAWVLAGASERVIVTNEHHRQELMRLRPSVATKIAVIPVGSNILPDADVWSQRSNIRKRVRRRMGIGPKTVLLSHFGQIYRGKGLDILFQALQGLSSSYHDVRLVVLGHFLPAAEAYRSQLLQQAKEGGIEDRVTWVPDCLEKDVSQYLLASDIYVVPYDEGLTTRRTSAMIGFAHGLPVVSTAGPSTPVDFKTGQNVVLVPPLDAGLLQMALSNLIMSPSRRAAYVAASLAVADKFSWARIADRFVQLMENLL